MVCIGKGVGSLFSLVGGRPDCWLVWEVSAFSLSFADVCLGCMLRHRGHVGRSLRFEHFLLCSVVIATPHLLLVPTVVNTFPVSGGFSCPLPAQL